MGLTIHYALKSGAQSPKKAGELLARLRSRALDLPFKEVGQIVDLSGPACDFNQLERDHPLRWLLIQAGQYVDDAKREGYSYRVMPTHVIAFSTWPGEGCEEANFGLCRYPATIQVDHPNRLGSRRTMRTRLAAGPGRASARRSTPAGRTAAACPISSAATWLSSRCSTTPGPWASWRA